MTKKKEEGWDKLYLRLKKMPLFGGEEKCEKHGFKTCKRCDREWLAEREERNKKEEEANQKRRAVPATVGDLEDMEHRIRSTIDNIRINHD